MVAISMTHNEKEGPGEFDTHKTLKAKGTYKQWITDLRSLCKMMAEQKWEAWWKDKPY